ncbi:hypothetical protein GCM10010174_05160 [Kutzneria viridogrisea]|uniref:Uncharacterized protein n=2 Tax=Kutzneria TaxID=43356 RepID=W5WAA2_9PSEU|nr:hypothetical protein [Kutzneria albida]AHH98073.1 hypothetical protein KALB_4711 [Kutzneria albida DSM 43870]MBA8924267.1 hypothetical protein [Kutzneria viridogrisea]
MASWQLIAAGVAGVILLGLLLWTLSAAFGVGSVSKKAPKGSAENRRLGWAQTLNVLGLAVFTEGKILLPEGGTQYAAIGVAVLLVVIGVSMVIATEKRLKGA